MVFKTDRRVQIMIIDLFASSDTRRARAKLKSISMNKGKKYLDNFLKSDLKSLKNKNAQQILNETEKESSNVYKFAELLDNDELTNFLEAIKLQAKSRGTKKEGLFNKLIFENINGKDLNDITTLKALKPKIRAFLLAKHKTNIEDDSQNTDEKVIDADKPSRRMKYDDISAKLRSLRLSNVLKVFMVLALWDYIKIKEKAAANRNEDTKTPKDKTNDPGIFKGLANGANYCYLNTALQELYGLERFRSKVLASNPPETEDYKELRAVKFFFEYLSDKMVDADFEKKREDMAKDLGYDGSQKNSATAKRNIETKCRSQMRILKGKSSLEPPEEVGQKELDFAKLPDLADKWRKYAENESDEQFENFINSAHIIEELYSEKDIRDKVIGIDENELTLKDYDKLEIVIKLFKLKNQGDAKFYSETTHDIILTLGNNQSYHGLKQEILTKINQFNRSKKAHILSTDSTIDISIPQENVLKSLQNTFDKKRKEGMAYYLPLKNDRFSVQFSDRTSGDPSRSNFSVEETLDLTKLINDKKLKIFVKNKQIEKPNYKFQLISASIGTGWHYYLYKKAGNKWKEQNDTTVADHTWDEIKNDINGMCETLTYKLM